MDLINKNRRLMKLKEKGRIVFCHITLGQIVQRHIFTTDVLLVRQWLTCLFTVFG